MTNELRQDFMIHMNLMLFVCFCYIVTSDIFTCWL